MPIAMSFKSMIESMRKKYPGGKEVCRVMADGSKICAGEKAWSIFYATMNKKKWDETKSLSNLDLSIEYILSSQERET